MEKKINKLEAIIKEYLMEVGPRKDPWQSAEAEPNKVDKEVHKEVRQAHEASTDDGLKPMHPKDTKPLPEFDGSRKDFMPWHESFTSVLRLRSAKWGKIVDWLKAKRDNRVLDGQAEANFLAYSKNHGPDEYIEKNFDLFSKHLCSYLVDFTKDKARVEVLANNEGGVFETYRLILHRGLNISDERRLDVEAKVLNPRRTKNDKDILAALRDCRQDQAWLVEADYTYAHHILKE